MKRVSYNLLLAWLLINPLLVNAQQGVLPHVLMQSSWIIPADSVNGIKVHELSGLSWDKDEQLLYAISDKGHIFHLRLSLEGNQIRGVQPVYAAFLTDIQGEVIKKGRRDSEGLTVLNANNGKKGDTQLVISFEGVPRIIRFTPWGRAIKNIDLPKVLQDQTAYQHGNDALESVTFHPRYGFITAPELPLRGMPSTVHTLYSTKGQQWSFMAYTANHSGISALETLPNGNLLIMERAWSGLFSPLVISLRYLDLAQCPSGSLCNVQDLYVMSNYLFIDNYEGLTHIQGNQYLIVSDDGNEDLLTTTLTLFTLD